MPLALSCPVSPRSHPPPVHPPMSILAALTTALLFSGSAVAQINYPSCIGHALWDWTSNSINQNPCEVAAYLQSTCSQGTFTVPALPVGFQYSGPTAQGGDDLCKCNTVTYSLLSACGGCQEDLWISWSQWASNCTTVLPPSTFPNPVPSGTRVPQWALRDVTRDVDSLWDALKAYGVGDTPEIGPGALIGISSPATGSGTGTGSGSGSGSGSSTTPGTSPGNPTALPKSGSSPAPSSSSPDSSTTSGHGGLNTGVIVGAAVGGASVIALAILVCVFYLRHRSPPSTPSSNTMSSLVGGDRGASQPPYEPKMPLQPDDGSHASSLTLQAPVPPIGPIRVYSPNDSSRSSVYPEYQEAPSPHAPDASARPTSFATYTPSNILATEPGRYHGLPIV